MMSKGEGHGCTFFIELPLYAKSTSANAGDNLIRKDQSLGHSARHDNSACDVRRGQESDGICAVKGPGSTRHVEVTGGRNQNSRFHPFRGIAGASVSIGRRRCRDSEGFADTTGHLLSGVSQYNDSLYNYTG